MVKLRHKIIIISIIAAIGLSSTALSSSSSASSSQYFPKYNMASNYTSSYANSYASLTSSNTKKPNSLTNGGAPSSSNSSSNHITGNNSSITNSTKPMNANNTAPLNATNQNSYNNNMNISNLELYTDPNSNISINARSWASANPANAALMYRLAATPMAQWFGNWNNNVQSDVNAYVSAAKQVNQMPVLVAYNIPFRDCGGASSGGAANDSAYLGWISNFAAGINNRPAMVILEPDALAGLNCLSSAEQTNRLNLIAQAVSILKTQSDSKVYIDAGNSNWQSAQVMQQRLNSANIAQADGFSLNVSNYYSTSSNQNYGYALSRLLDNKHFVIDVSRNGNGPNPQPGVQYPWCNPANMAVGQNPTLNTGNHLIDGYLWIKGAGESDGACGPSVYNTSAPAAGQWWPQSALQLMRNAHW